MQQALNQFRQLFTEIPFNRILGLTLDAIEPDHIIIRFSMKQDLIGNYMHGILHGGVISSVLDMAGGAAAMAAIIQKKPPTSADDLTKLFVALGKTSTISLNVDFLQPGKGEIFFAKAWITHSGAQITFTSMELHNEETTLIATGSASYWLAH